MKGETQSVHLQKMMQQHKRYPEYELALPSFSIKKKNLKKMRQGDVLLLGLDFLDLVLLEEGEVCAKVTVEHVSESLKLRIVSLEEKPADKHDSKKYENIFSTFTTLQIRKLEVGHKVEVPTLEIRELALFLRDEKRFKGLLVMVDDEIAIEITEVLNG